MAPSWLLFMGLSLTACSFRSSAFSSSSSFYLSQVEIRDVPKVEDLDFLKTGRAGVEEILLRVLIDGSFLGSLFCPLNFPATSSTLLNLYPSLLMSQSECCNWCCIAEPWTLWRLFLMVLVQAKNILLVTYSPLSELFNFCAPVCCLLPILWLI